MIYCIVFKYRKTFAYQNKYFTKFLVSIDKKCCIFPRQLQNTVILINYFFSVLILQCYGFKTYFTKSVLDDYTLQS